MVFQYIIQSLYAIALLFLVFKICQLINVCIIEAKQLYKLKQEIMKKEFENGKN